MTTCKACGMAIAKSAKACPNCGAKNSKPFFTKWWFWVLVVFIFLGVIGSGGSKTARTNDKPATQTSTTTKDYAELQNPSNSTESTIPEDKPTPEPDIWIKGGTYKVGVDIEPGEYLVVATKAHCYVEVDKDSTGTFESIVSNENISTRLYYTLLDGQYFKVQGGKFAKVDDIAPYEPENGVYEQGMYLVGKDIPAGEYKVTANDAHCYIEIDKDSYNIFNSIISNDNISLGESTYITVSEGQYIKFNGGQIILP